MTPINDNKWPPEGSFEAGSQQRKERPLSKEGSEQLAVTPIIQPNDIYVGKFNEHIRQLFINYRVERYLFENPGASRSKAGKYARVAWRRKASGGKRK